MKILLLCLLLAVGIAPLAAQDEPPAISQSNRNDFFISDAVVRKYNLQLGQHDEWMKVYNYTSADYTIFRVNDIRWQAATRDAAIRWYINNPRTLSEGGKNLTSEIPKPAGVDQFNAYGGNEENTKMMEALGLKQNQFCFTFTVDQFIGKIFVSTTDKLNVHDAWRFAKDGVRATLAAAGKKRQADQLY
jgi:hypothetical protein